MANTKNSLYLSDDLQDYLEKQCEAFGMGKSAFISMVLTFYRQQTQAMAEIAKLDSYLSRLEEMVAKNESKNG